mgnify:CR=1 FL=1
MSDRQIVDKATVAFRRLLKDAASGDQARVDTLVVLAQRTFFAVNWPGSDTEIRTLTNSSGETAMPLFTSRDVMQEAARRYGWHSPDGSLPNAEIGARQALRQAIGRSVQFVVVDIGTDYSVEFTLEEIEPLLSAQDERVAGPFAGSGKVSTTLLQAVKRSRSTGPPEQEGSQVPAAARIATPPPLPGVSAGLPRGSGSSPSPASVADAARSTPPVAEAKWPPGVRPPKTITMPETPIARSLSDLSLPAVQPDRQIGPEQVELRPLPQPLGEELLDAVSEKLRQYPEVEWACTVGGKIGERILSVIGLRVDPSFATRLDEIVAGVREQCKQQGNPVQVLHLTSFAQLGGVRELGTVFYPWRKGKPRVRK